MRTPNLHRAKIAQKECGWKDGDRCGPAQPQKTSTGEEKEKRREKQKRKIDLILTGLFMAGVGSRKGVAQS